MDEFTLKYPVVVGKQTTGSLSLRRPKGRDMEALESRKGGDMKITNELIADLAGVDIEVIRELDLEDSAKITAWLEPLLDPNGRRSRTNGD